MVFGQIVSTRSFCSIRDLNSFVALRPSPQAARLQLSFSSRPRFKTLQGEKAKRSVQKNQNPGLQQDLQKAPEDRRNKPGIAAKGKTTILWFRNDLRLHDNQALVEAQNSSTAILPVYIFDKRNFQKRVGPFKARFILECVSNLRSRLEELGSRLIVRLGCPEEILPSLSRSIGASDVICQEEATKREFQIQEGVNTALEEIGCRLKSIWASTLHKIGDLPFKLENMPGSFGEFQKGVKDVAIAESLREPDSIRSLSNSNLEDGEIPSLKGLGFSDDSIRRSCSEPGLGQVIGGEGEAIRQLNVMNPESCGRTTREDISRFSTWLVPPFGYRLFVTECLQNSGCLSPRRFYEQLAEHCKGKRNEVLTELLWHDFYRYSFRKESLRSSKVYV